MRESAAACSRRVLIVSLSLHLRFRSCRIRQAPPSVWLGQRIHACLPPPFCGLRAHAAKPAASIPRTPPTFRPKLPHPAGAPLRMASATHSRLPATAVLWSAGARSQACGVHPLHSEHFPPVSHILRTPVRASIAQSTRRRSRYWSLLLCACVPSTLNARGALRRPSGYWSLLPERRACLHILTPLRRSPPRVDHVLVAHHLLRRLMRRLVAAAGAPRSCSAASIARAACT